MSRSRRKTPIFGNGGAESEKQDKRRCNRIQRRMAREIGLNPLTTPFCSPQSKGMAASMV